MSNFIENVTNHSKFVNLLNSIESLMLNLPIEVIPLNLALGSPLPVLKGFINGRC